MSKRILLYFQIYFHIINIILLNTRLINASSLTCKISVPNSVTSQKLNNVMCLGKSGFAYSNFATFSNGSLIIESSKDKGTEERIFYGITKEGTPYFKENQYFMSFNTFNGDYRKEAENFIIRLNDAKESEYLISISDKLNIELYDLNLKKVISKSSVKLLIGDNEIMDCQIQTGINYKENEINYLFYGVTSYDFDFYLYKIIFNSTDLSKINKVKSIQFNPVRGRVASCYITDKNFIHCIVMQKILLVANIMVYVYDTNLSEKHKINLEYIVAPSGISFPYFIKCIHLNEENGIFSFYKTTNSYSTTMVKHPVILFKTFNNNKLIDYISQEIILDKKEFNMESAFNDLIRVNENKVCFISTSENKDKMFIVLLSLYGTSNKNVGIRYYTVDTFSVYTFKFYKNIRANLYNNFISFAFSFCRTSNCASDSDTHYPGFMIFNYPNGTDHKDNLIDYMLTKNEKIENYLINLKNYVNIDNNIFGLISKGLGIKNLINCNSFNLTYQQRGYIIKEGYYLDNGENIILNLLSLEKTECSIKYVYYITEPDFDEYNQYPTEKVFPSTYSEAYFNNEKNNYQSRIIYYNISIKEDLSNNCNDEKCSICRDNRRDYCIVCKYNYIINKDENGILYKICAEEGINITNIIDFIEETEPNIVEEEEEEEKNIREDIHTLLTENINKMITNINTNTNDISTSENILIKKISYEIEKQNTCTLDTIISKECQDIKISNTEMKEIYIQIKEKYLSNNYKNQSQIIYTENVIYQVSTFEYQRENNEPNVSSIDLGTCENTLKSKYNLEKTDSLIVFKIDIKSEDKSQTYVHYEIYEPYNYTLLNISLCENKIIINTPIDLSDDSIMLYDNLKQYGYNIFDSSDDFYTDVCSTFTTPNGTDMLIEERKKKIYSMNGNYTMCQTGCNFILYNTTTKKSMCDCEIRNESIDFVIDEEHFSTKKLAKEFLSTITNSNFIVLKCYKLAFNFNKVFKNIGRIIMSVILIFYLVSLLCYIIFERKKIDIFINIILDNKNSLSKNTKNIHNPIQSEEEIKKKNKKEKKEKKTNSNSKNKSKSKENKGSKNKRKKKNEPPKKSKDNKKEQRKVFNNSSTRNLDIHTISSLSPQNQKKNKNININIYPINEANLDKKRNGKIENVINAINNINIKKNDLNTNFIKDENLNEQELNSLDYNIAVYIDKRTYFQYYWSLLKKKHLILFTFIPANDYNLFSLKIALFLLSFSLYFTINGFFFTDSTMNKITENNGSFDFIYQIPQILYSSIISAIINMLLKILSLSEKNIIFLKQEKDFIIAKNESKRIRKCIIFKFILFFIISNLLLIFFWYFITCFCAVYVNTQAILFKDTIISFGLSMLYPFVLNLLPGFLRIPALRDTNKNSKCLYQLSGFIALI